MPGYVRVEHKLVAEDYQDPDFRLVMRPSGGISGTVVDAVSGKGLDVFRVQLSRPSGLSAGQTAVHSYSSSWSSPGRTFRNTDGRWSAIGEGFQPGAWVGVRVFAEGYVSQTAERVLIPEDPEASPLRFAMTKGASLEGFVLPEAGGQPIVGATVTALREGELDAWRDLKRQGYPQAKTNGQGHFRMDGLPSGDLWLRAEHPSWPTKTVGPIPMPVSGSPAPQTILLDSGASLYGMVRGQDGMAVLGAKVTIIRQVPLLVQSTTTDIHGEYRFEHLADGIYDITAERVPNLADSISMSMRTLLQDAQDVCVDLDATGTSSVTGTITWDGALPKRLEMELSHPSRWDASTLDLEPGSAVPLGYSAPILDGKFHFPAVMPGIYDLLCMFTAEDRSFHVGQLRIEVLPDSNQVVDLEIQ